MDGFDLSGGEDEFAEQAVGRLASSGHRLGQMIGDLLEGVFTDTVDRLAEEFGLYHDYKGKERPARGRKLIWYDEYGNGFDLDHVLERGGTDTVLGEPVGFIEVFFRRYAKHSRNKAKEDAGKLVPLLSRYPSTRFLGIIGAGVFTRPAIDEVESKGIRMFHIPVDQVFNVYRKYGAQMNYPETLEESEKRVLLEKAQRARGLEESLPIYIERLRRDLNRQVTSVSLTRRSQSSVRVHTLGEAIKLMEQNALLGESVESHRVSVDFDNHTTAHAEFASPDELASYLQTLATSA